MLEMKKLNENLDGIVMLLRTTIDQIPESSASEKEKARYNDMVDQIILVCKDFKNPKQAYLSFRVVEQTIKRAYINSQIQDYSLVSIETLQDLKQKVQKNVTNAALQRQKTKKA